MIGSLRGWTHFRPLLTTQAGYYAPPFLVSIPKSAKTLSFSEFRCRVQKLLFACCRPPIANSKPQERRVHGCWAPLDVYWRARFEGTSA